MAQYAVHRNVDLVSAHRYPFLVDVQHDLLSFLATRLVMPVVPAEQFKDELMFTLMPVVDVSGKRHVVLATHLTTVPCVKLGPAVTSLAGDPQPIKDAVEMLVYGL